MTAFTPGPWTAKRYDYGWAVEYGHQGFAVCSVLHNSDGSMRTEHEANARLIATAPYMLASLETLNAIASPNPERTFDSVIRDLNAMTDIARAAIAKATTP